MNVSINGARRDLLPAEATLADVVATVTAAASGVAVAVNGEVVPRAEWSSTVLGEGDRIEVLTAAQGG
ncbi:MAG: sulfur carrier protein ThiS [Micromonosporaceae bacterium]